MKSRPFSIAIASLIAGLCIVLLANPLGSALPGEANTQPVASGRDVFIEMAFSQNPDLLKLNYRRERMVIERDRYGLMSTHPIYQEATKNLQALDNGIAAFKERLAYQVTDMLWQLVLVDAQLKVQQSSINSLARRVVIEEERLAAGLSTEVMLTSLQLSHDSAVLSLKRLLNSRDILRMNLNLLLGQAPTTAIAYAEELSFSPVEVDLLQSLELAFVSSISPLQSAREAYEDADDHYRNIYNPQYDPFGHGANLEHVRRAKLAAEEAETDYLKEKRSVEVALRTRYLELNAARQAVELSAREKEFEQYKLELEERKLAVGLTTSLAVADQLHRTTTAQLDYLNKVYQYHKALGAYRLAEKGI